MSEPIVLAYRKPGADLPTYTGGYTCARCGNECGAAGHHNSICLEWIREGRGLVKSLRQRHWCCPGDCELTPKPREVKP